MSVFSFKYFDIQQNASALKVGTDSMLLGALCDPKNAKYLLDVGAGTGVLSLMMAQKNTTAQIDAIEIEKNAFKECTLNFNNSNWSDRLHAFESDFFTFDAQHQYDIIISNPPFYLEDNISMYEPLSIAKHWNMYKINDLYKKCASLSHIQTKLVLIIPHENLQTHFNLANENGWFLEKQINIHSKPSKPNTRSVLYFTRELTALKEEELTIREEDNSYTSQYITLTKEFHNRDLNEQKIETFIH